MVLHRSGVILACSRLLVMRVMVFVGRWPCSGVAYPAAWLLGLWGSSLGHAVVGRGARCLGDGLLGMASSTVLLATSCVAPSRGVWSFRGSFLSGDNVDQEVKHVAFRQGTGYITSLKGSTFVFLGVDPCSHCKLGDEDVTSFGEEDGRFGANHFDFGVGFHDLLDTGKR